MATIPSDMLDKLPWEDVIFKYILPDLQVRVLFQLRAASKQWKNCIELYFETSRTVNIVNTGSKFNISHFEIITSGAYNVRTLFIRNANNWLSDTALIPFIANNPNLEKVDLSGSTCISDKIPHCIASACQNLRELTLRDCNWLTDAALNMVSMNCDQLERLDISGCWNTTDSSVKNIALLCVKLKFLSLAKIYGLTDASVSLIARNLPLLEHLNLQGCWRITDTSVFLLCEYCKNLKKIQVRECRDVSIACMQKLEKRGVIIDVLRRTPKMTVKHLPYMKGFPM